MGVPGDPLDDPGLEAHEPRPTDVDEHAEKRAERQIALLFGLSSVFALLFAVAYFVFEVGPDADIIGGYGASNVALGVCLGMALLLIGVGAIQWARKLMNDEELVEMRHPASSSDEDRQAVVASFQEGVNDSGIARRPLIRNTLLGAFATLGLPLVLVLRDLGPLPGSVLARTVWKKGMRLTNDVAGTPIKPEEVEIGQLINGEPAVFFEEEDGEPVYRGRRAQRGEGQGRHHHRPDEARRHQCGQGPGELGRRRHPVLLQDLHPRRVPDLPVGAADAPSALPLPPVHLRPRRQRQGDLRTSRSCSAATAYYRG